jgi:hypothetical protein
MNEASFDIPEGFRDNTVHVLVEGDEIPSSFSLVINRDRLSEREELVEFVERQIERLSESLSELRIIDRAQRPVASAIALEVEFAWSAEQGLMCQRQVFIPQDGAVLILTATTLDAFTEAQRNKLDALLESFAFSTPPLDT